MSRELDSAISRALGYKVEVERSHRPCQERYYEITGQKKVSLPHYSTDGNDMLELDREMRERGFEINVNFSGSFGEDAWQADYYKRGMGIFVAHAKTEPLARALVACEALTGKEWAE